MDLTFLNGSDHQHEVVRDALRSLLHLNLDRFNFSVEVSFAPNPVSDPLVHHPFAVTVTGFPTTITIRDDFPHFQVGGAMHSEYASLDFARETVIHELGHALLHRLPRALEEEIADLFDTTPDTWNPTGVKWENRPEEGIAETFKDAFLPNSQREFTNRTNVAIPIRKYQDFRHIFRESAATGGEEFREDFDSGSFVNEHDEGFFHVINLLTDATQPDGWRITWLKGDQQGGANYPHPTLGSGLLRTNVSAYIPQPPFFNPNPPAGGANIRIGSAMFRDGVYEAAMIAPPLAAGACSGSVEVAVPDSVGGASGNAISCGMSRDSSGVVTVSCSGVALGFDLWAGGLNIIDRMSEATVAGSHVNFIFRITIDGNFATFYIADRDTSEELFTATVDLTQPQSGSNSGIRQAFIASSQERLITSRGITSGGVNGDHFAWDYILYQPGGIEGEDVPSGETNGAQGDGGTRRKLRVVSGGRA